MKILADISDNEYPLNGFTHMRNTVRAVVINDKNEIALLHIVGEDIFGKRNHYETPGGGIEEYETYETALKRELVEEIGYACEVIGEIGMIISRYNLIGRINISRFYVAKILHKEKLHRTDEENRLIKDIEFKRINDWLEVLKRQENSVDRLVHKRELIALNAFKAQYNKLLDSGSIHIDK